MLLGLLLSNAGLLLEVRLIDDSPQSFRDPRIQGLKIWIDM